MQPGRHRPAWLIWLVSGIVIAVTYPIQPWHLSAAATSGVVGVLSCVLVMVGIRWNRPPDLSGWLFILVGQLFWVVGDGIYLGQMVLGVTPTLPSVSDLMYLCAYPLFAFGLFRLSRRRRSRRMSIGYIDSAITATSIAIVYWVFVVGPIATDPSLTAAARLSLVGYPTGGVVLCAVVLPVLLRRGPRPASIWLLTVGSAFSLLGNIGYTLLPGFMAAHTEIVYGGYLLAYVCWAAAALHPSAGRPVPEPAAEHFGRARIVGLTVSMLLVPAVLLIRRSASGENLNWLIIGLGSAVLFILISLRLFGFVLRSQRQAARLSDLAMRDDLTGLANRRSFEHEVTGALDAGTPQVAVIDLADFKHINDRLGRSTADRALVAVAGRLAEVAPAPQVVARVGGDEFALLVPDATAAEADEVARRVAESLRRPVVTDGHELLLNVRIGIAGGEGVADAGELLRRADTALDAAKRHGSRFRRYDAELDDDAEEAASLGAELRHALDGEQFRVVYQPIVELPEGRTVAVEALVRWQHPVRGFVSPADFIPVAERNGLIVELGAWIMRTACAQAVAWRAELGEDAPHYVSVNVSAHQLAQPDFAAFVASVLESTGLCGPRLLVEVTETAIFEGGPAVRTLEKLRELGVRIALDDFGTGHSSLGLLQNVPVDVLKVDKSFVDNITMSGRHAVIAEALIKVAEGLGLQAVAEGVETADQAAELHRLGYRLAQGYHFGKPVAQPEFRPALVSRRY